MEVSELRDALDGLFAYDTGCTDSGIHNEALRTKVIVFIHSLDDKAFNRVLGKAMWDLYLTDDALANGYGIEAANSFIQGLSRNLGICV